MEKFTATTTGRFGMPTCGQAWHLGLEGQLRTTGDVSFVDGTGASVAVVRDRIAAGFVPGTTAWSPPT